MARPRKKKRTHVGHVTDQQSKSVTTASAHDPKSMVIRMGAGEIGPGISQLTKDVRRMMEPGTAARLKERRSNKLRDYTAMAGPLGISHLLLLSRSELGNTSIRIALTPRGPTLTFRVQTYSLAKDIQRMQKRPCTQSKDFLSAPLLIMSNFITDESSNASLDKNVPQVPKHLETLVTSVFQSLFPPVKANDTPLTSIRRVILLTRHRSESAGAGKFVVSLRHYAVSTRPANVPRGIRRLPSVRSTHGRGKLQGRTFPTLHRLDDVADVFLEPGRSQSDYNSHSETELDTEVDVDVPIADVARVAGQRRRVRSRAAQGSLAAGTRAGAERRRVRLAEVGPRLLLRMTKVEEDLCGGKVMWHDYIEKSAEESVRMDRDWDERRAKKLERRRIQRENVGKKRQIDSHDVAGAQGSRSHDTSMDDSEPNI